MGDADQPLWIAKAGSGPVTVTCWFAGQPAAGALVLEHLTSAETAFAQVAVNPSVSAPVTWEEPDTGAPADVDYRVSAVAGSPSGQAQGLYHRCEQAGAVLRYQDSEDYSIHPPPWAGLPLPPDCPNNDLATRRFSLRFAP